MDRREFLKRTATAAAIAAVVPSALIAAANPNPGYIGVDWGAGDDQTVIRTLVLGPERLEMVTYHQREMIIWPREMWDTERRTTPRRT